MAPPRPRDAPRDSKKACPADRRLRISPYAGLESISFDVLPAAPGVSSLREPGRPPLLDCPTGMAELEIKPTPKMRLRVFALIGAGAAISLVLMYLLVGGGQDFFARRTTLTTYMPDAQGVTRDSEVRLSGVRIGKVQKVELSGLLDPRRAVRTEMRVLTRYLKGIPEDSQTDVSEDNLVGDKFIDIAEGKSPLPIKEDGVLESEPVKQAADRADLIRILQNNLAQVDQILADMSSPD